MSQRGLHGQMKVNREENKRGSIISLVACNWLCWEISVCRMRWSNYHLRNWTYCSSFYGGLLMNNVKWILDKKSQISPKLLGSSIHLRFQCWGEQDCDYSVWISGEKNEVFSRLCWFPLFLIGRISDVFSPDSMHNLHATAVLLKSAQSESLKGDKCCCISAIEKYVFLMVYQAFIHRNWVNFVNCLIICQFIECARLLWKESCLSARRLIYLIVFIRCRSIHEPESLKAFSSNHLRERERERERESAFILCIEVNFVQNERSAFILHFLLFFFFFLLIQMCTTCEQPSCNCFGNTNV